MRFRKREEPQYVVVVQYPNTADEDYAKGLFSKEGAAEYIEYCVMQLPERDDDGNYIFPRYRVLELREVLGFRNYTRKRSPSYGPL